MRQPAKEEPQILDHPEGIGENTLAYWRPRLLACLIRTLGVGV